MLPFQGIPGSQQIQQFQQKQPPPQLQQQQQLAFPQSQQGNQQFVPKKVIENYSYQLTDQIGKGYSSKVFRGKDERTEEEVAVKVIDMKLMSNEVQLFLLQNEISVMKRLSTTNNLNLLKLADYYQTANNTYIITDICNQGDLKELLAKYASLEESQALKILKHLLNGYKELAKNRIVHRDIKPANILLNNGIPKLADFGFAKDIDSPPYKYYYNVGTPMYMCPQSLQKNEYSEKSDIWSIGVLYYELIFGVTPWKAETEKELRYKVCNVPVTFPTHKQITNESKDFIVGCLQVDERRRFSFEQLETHSIHKLNFKKDKNQHQQKQNPSSSQSTAAPSGVSQKQHENETQLHKPSQQAPLKRGNSNQAATSNGTLDSAPVLTTPSAVASSNQPEIGKENYSPSKDPKNLHSYPSLKLASKTISENLIGVSEQLGNQQLSEITKKVSQPAAQFQREDHKTLLEQPQNFQIPAKFIAASSPMIPQRSLEQEDITTIITNQPMMINGGFQDNINGVFQNNNNNQAIPLIDNLNSNNIVKGIVSSSPTTMNTSSTPTQAGSTAAGTLNASYSSPPIYGNSNTEQVKSHSSGDQQQQQQPVSLPSTADQQPQQQIQAIPTPQSNSANSPLSVASQLSRNDQIILAQINMCRFLFRLAKLAEDTNILETPLLKEKLIFLIMKNILVKISHLKTMSEQLTNSLQLTDWRDYLKSESFHRFQMVISEYYSIYSAAFNEKLSIFIQQHSMQFHRDKKFQAIFDDNPLEFESFYLILQSFLRHSIREINHLTKIKLNSHSDTSLPAENEKNIVLLDYLVTYFQLTNLLLDQFNDYGFFADNSRIEQIAGGKPVRLTKTHFAQIRQKIYSLEI